MTKKTVATEVVEALRDLGVKHVFGVPSGGWIDYMEAMRKTDGIEFVLATHEGGAGFMADVSGRLSGAPGVCFGTFGPGATNLATGVGSALLDRSPMIALTDEMPAKMRERTTQMGIDHQALFEPITKATTRLTADCPRKIIFEAAHLAQSERPGPVHVGLPQGMSAEIAGVSRADPKESDTTLLASADSLELAAEYLRRAQKPLIVIGLAAVRASLAEPVVAIARSLGAPIVLTPMAKGMLSESHPLYAGVLFHALSDVVAETYGQADSVLAVGYDPIEFNYEQWMPEVPLLNLDTQPVDIDLQEYPDVVDVTGDIATSLAFVASQDLHKGQWDLDALADRRTQMFSRMTPASTDFGPCSAIEVLRDCFPNEGIMTCDVGAHIGSSPLC